MANCNVLLVGIDPVMANSLRNTFFDETFNTVVVKDVQAAWQALQEQEEMSDLVFLGPDLDSTVKLEFCRRLRGDLRTEPVSVMLATCHASESEEVEGFEAGVDDVVVMPRSERLIVERMKAHIRRKRHLRNKNVLQRRAVRLDRDCMQLSIGRETFQLTPTECRIVWILIDRDGRPVTRRELLEACGGNAWGLLERTIDGHVKVLRKKLGSRGTLIETVWGLGYRIGNINLGTTGHSANV